LRKKKNEIKNVSTIHSPRVCLINLGCPKNQVDTETALEAFSRQGFIVVQDPETADALVINTCAFIRPAEEETIQTVLEAAQLKKKGRVGFLLVVGCWVAKHGEQKLKKLVPEIDEVALPNTMDQWVDILCRHYVMPSRLVRPAPRDLSRGYLLSGPGTAYLKIAEGCSRCCTFCLIPRLRGPLRSRPINAILSEAKALVKRGIRELVLVAQDTTQYGRDLYGSSALTKLLSQLVRISGLQWVRVMYTNPDGIDECLIQMMAREPKLCKYLDIPVQHAHFKILRAMGRVGKAQQFLDLINHLRESIPGIVLRTTLLTGFPGETENEHCALMEFVAKAQFDRLGVFTFSPEAGTRAATMAGQVHPGTRQRRKRELMKLQQGISRMRLARHVNTIMECIVEEPSGENHMLGRTVGDAPEVDGGIVLTGKARPGTIVRARITGSTDHDLTGVIM